MSIAVRVARESDRERILAISAQIWDGYDYVPHVLDGWLAGREGELLVAEIDSIVAAFSYRTWLADGHAWLQGIRTDTAMRGRGAGRTLTEASIERSWRDGARRIGLSTHIDNAESMHIVEAYGFRRVAAYVYLEGELAEGAGLASGTIDALPEEDAIRFVAGSDYLRRAGGRFPWAWKFLAFDWAPRTALGWAPYRIGVRRDGEWVAALCAAPQAGASDAVFLCVLDGEPDDMAALLRVARSELAAEKWEAMAPKDGDRGLGALGLLRGVGLRSWSEFAEDVFAYELDQDEGLTPGKGARP
jgi:ribosomal protein S18 acetylase RimI-like enzyme